MGYGSEAASAADPRAPGGGAVLLGRLTIVPGDDRAAAERLRGRVGGQVALCFAAGGEDARLVDAGAALGTHCDLILLTPYRFLAAALPDGATPDRLAPGIALRLLYRYLAGLAAATAALADAPARLAEGAVRNLLAAALQPAAQGLGSRRRATLLERAIAAIDADLGATMPVGRLCAVLGCSRSALYRATERAGGVAELVLTRRLIAARAALDDPADQRAVAAIAHDLGFGDAAGFNRRFKQRYGIPPGAVRHGHAHAA